MRSHKYLKNPSSRRCYPPPGPIIEGNQNRSSLLLVFRSSRSIPNKFASSKSTDKVHGIAANSLRAGVKHRRLMMNWWILVPKAITYLFHIRITQRTDCTLSMYHEIMVTRIKNGQAGERLSQHLNHGDLDTRCSVTKMGRSWRTTNLRLVALLGSSWTIQRLIGYENARWI